MNRPLLRATVACALLLAPLAASPAQAPAPQAARKAAPEAILEVLEQSLKTSKGVMLYVGNHAIGGAVTKIGEVTVELRNREYGRIVLRLDRIDGAALN